MKVMKSASILGVALLLSACGKEMATVTGEPVHVSESGEIVLPESGDSTGSVYEVQAAGTANEIKALQRTFIVQLYNVGLRRSADVKGLAYWLGRVQNGEVNCRQIVNSFLRAESVGTLRTRAVASRPARVDYMVAAYRVILGRDPDSNGFVFYQSAIYNQNLSVSGIDVALENSAEFRARCARAAIPR